MAIEPSELQNDEFTEILADAFIYAYPMLFNYKTLYNQALNPEFSGYVGGFGKFRNYDRTYTPADTDIVTANNDTPYSWAWLDLRVEPSVLTIPAVPGDRYVTFQWFDMFTYNFAYVGVLSTGREAGSYLSPVLVGTVMCRPALTMFSGRKPNSSAAWAAHRWMARAICPT